MLRPHPNRSAPPAKTDGSAFTAPRQRDIAAWRTLTVLFNAGVGFHKSCCGGPSYRPRSLPEVRARMTYARRSGEPDAKALARRDVACPPALSAEPAISRRLR
ncbi:deoxyxylulose-5-phosphate synthase [Streptomyces sp. NPDC051684]|uniref:deoxyxylulose-5-phosphate synthase n=1 Tax=Streptomyces sp. NPDC051684 TaxID=3365670 RepID=UPI003791A036